MCESVLKAKKINVGEELETESQGKWKRKRKKRWSKKIMYAIINDKWLIHI